MRSAHIVFFLLFVLVVPAQCQQTAKDWLNRGTALASQGNYDEAVQAYDEAIKLNSSSVQIWNYKGIALTELGKYDEAVEAYAQFWYNKGLGLANQGNYSEAIKAFDEAVSLDRDIAKWPNLQIVFNATGINITPGQYDSRKVVVPMGLHELSFEIRTIPDNLTYQMHIDNRTITNSVGAGKTYREENFTIYKFDMDKENGYQDLSIEIAHCCDSAGFLPKNPFSHDVFKSYTLYSTDSKTVDGHPAEIGYSYRDSNTDSPTLYTAIYQMDSKTFVKISSRMNWDKDVSLVLESLHIAKIKV